MSAPAGDGACNTLVSGQFGQAHTRLPSPDSMAGDVTTMVMYRRTAGETIPMDRCCAFCVHRTS
jgi:hypothetical protein